MKSLPILTLLLLSNIFSLDQKDISIYPNSIKDQLLIESHTDAIDKMIIKDIQGKTVVEFTEDFNTKQVDLSFSPQGLFFLTIIQKDKFTVKRIVKE